MRKIMFFLLLNFALFSEAIIKIGVPESLKELKEIKAMEALLQKTFSNLGYRVEYSYLPTLRSFENLEKGLIDGVFPAINERINAFNNIFYIEESLMEQNFYIYSKNVSSVFNWKNLENKNIGISFGTMVTLNLLNRNINEVNISELKETSSLRNMLISGRVDYLFLPEAQGNELLKEFPEDNIKKSQTPLASDKFYLLMNKRHLNLKEKIKKELIKEKAKIKQ